LSRAPLGRTADMVFAGRSVEFETIGQHNDGLRAALAFNIANRMALVRFAKKPPPIGGIRRASVERDANQKLRRQAESERDHQQEPESGEHLQRGRRVDFARIVSVETVRRRIVIPVRRHSVP
jgi:hypothetical protein